MLDVGANERVAHRARHDQIDLAAEQGESVAQVEMLLEARPLGAGFEQTMPFDPAVVLLAGSVSTQRPPSAQRTQRDFDLLLRVLGVLGELCVE